MKSGGLFMREKIIEVKNLSFKYNDKYVLKNINLDIYRGERIAILGENGAGKTTLIKHFNGLLKPFRGYVKVFGKDTRKVSVAELSRNIGIVFQNPDHQLFAETVEEEVAFALKNFGYDKETIKKRVKWAIEVMGLSQYCKSSPFALSDGERKRLAIASILCYDPDIIIFDEPTVGQDFFQKERLAEILKLLATRDKTIIVVTHDIEFIVGRFNRIIIISKGEIIADNHASKILIDIDLLKKANLYPPQLIYASYL
ncbi:MAG TPA: ABC transporter ATP-binding protein, partial [Thermoprotei archaeon]|nr:ABC transporter ATP-binding protein [Thermoprotei archaeon]